MASVSYNVETFMARRPRSVRVVGYIHDPSSALLQDRIDHLAIGAAVENMIVLDTFDDLEALGSRSDRPGLERAIAYVAAKRADGMLVENIGRLARQSRAAHELHQRIEALGASLWDQRYGRITPAKLELAGRVGVKRLQTSRARAEHVRIHGGWPRRITH